MSTYLLPIDDDSELYIDSCEANSFQDAMDKWLERFVNDFDIEDTVNDWNDLTDWLISHDIRIGEIYNIEEF